MKTEILQIVILLLIANCICLAGVTSPNGGEQICSGSTYTITWTIDNPMTLPPLFLNKATIYFSKYAPVPIWQPIAEDVNNNGSWDWNVPVYTSDETHCRIRVKTPEYDDVCDAVFTIKAPDIEVTAPGSGEGLWPGETFIIQWDSECISGAVEIALKCNKATTIIDASAANTGSYNWVVPDFPSTFCRIQITDTESGVSDISDSFTIMEPYITVTYPNGGEIIRVDDPCTITWDSRGTSGKVRILHDQGSGGASWGWRSIASDIDAADGMHDWTPDIFQFDPNYLIKIVDMDGNPSDISDGSFLLQGIRLVYGHLYHCSGSEWMIKWRSSATSGHLNLYSSSTGEAPWNFESELESDAGDTSTQTFVWTAPDEPSDHFRIKIEDAEDPTLFTVSNEYVVLPSPGFHVYGPGAGERFTKCTYYSVPNIGWISCGMSSEVVLEYSIDNGDHWHEIETVENEDGYNEYLPWYIPDDITSTSHQCKIRVTDQTTGIFGEGENFSIYIPALQLLTPNGGDIWPIGSTQEISCIVTDYQPIFGYLIFSYSIDSGEHWEDIEILPPYDSDYWECSYEWHIEEDIDPSDQCLIKAYLAGMAYPDENCTTSDTSDVFTLCQPHIEFVKPEMNENLLADENYTIRWDVCGTSGLLKIEFLQAGAGELELLGENIPADQCTLSWSVPDLNGMNHRLTITDMASPDYFDWVYFNIRGSCEAPAVWIPDYTVCGLDTIIVDVMLSGNEDPIDSFEFTLNASNWEMVDFLYVQRGDLTEHFDNFDFTIPDPDNEVDISASSAISIPSNSQGSLARVLTRVYCFEGSAYEPNSNLTLINRVGDISTYNHCAGLIEGEFCSKGDINCDHIIDDKDYHWVIDYFMSHYTYGYPECCGQCQLDVLDVVYDERITLADARVLYTAWENSALPPVDVESPVSPEEGIEVIFTQLECQPGDDVDIEVTLDNPLNLSEFGLYVSYRPGFMSFEGITAGSLTGGWDFLDANPIPTSEGPPESSGLLMLGGFNSESITSGTEGTLMVLHFHVHEDAEGYSTIDVLDYFDGLRRAGYRVGHVGIAESTAMKLKDSRIPQEYSLGKAYPNPFNQNMRFDFHLPERTDVHVEIFDTRGTLVRTLISKTLSPGVYQAEWNGLDDQYRAVASGQYVYRLKSDAFTAMEKCILLK
ncbi:T9SS type A sorting domain-containing protein [bacterium]|nr:T9SS type A sorting domain-containing protein [bacterium]